MITDRSRVKYISAFRAICGSFAFLFLMACSTDAEPRSQEVVKTREGNCFDGILNGDEVVVDCGGECPGFCPASSIGILGGELFGESGDEEQVISLQLDPDIEYRLVGPLLVRDKAILSIPAGTVIKADPGVGAYIAIAQGGRLLISGQPENPVVFTSGAENPSPGDWGGIVICGQGPIASGAIGRTDITDIFYGGPNEESGSGNLNYVRIEYAGALAENGRNFDAIAFYGVGSFTGITNVQTFESLGNGIRFIGGNAHAKQLLATNSGESAIVVQDDWSGNGDSWYVSGIAKAGIRISSDGTIETAAPAVADTISNVTIVGPSPAGGIHFTAGGGKYVLSNIHTSNLSLGINIEGLTEVEQIPMGNLKIDSIQFDIPAMDFRPTNYEGPGTDLYMENPTPGAGNGTEPPEWAKGWTVDFP